MLYDLIIIGGGPAGITAGIYAARQGIKTLLITKDFISQISKKMVYVENYPGFNKISATNLLLKFKEHLESQKIDIEKDEVVEMKKNGHFVVFTALKKEFKSRAVIIASGAEPRQLKVKGENQFIGKGVSYCAVCDGPLFSGKAVAIVGGGNSGFETAIALDKIVKKIYVLEGSSKITANKKHQGLVRKIGKAEIIKDAYLKEIRGDKFVSSLVYQDEKSGKEKELAVSGVFVEIGYSPSTSFIKDLVDFNDKGEIKVEPETCLTKTAGLFAAGDVNSGSFKQVVIACGEGAKAALAAFNYLGKNYQLNE